MKIITPGYKYELAHYDSYGLPDCPVQTVQFIEKCRKEGSDELFTVNDGTTNEEVLAMLIDRLQFLNQKIPCRDNSIAITHLEDALLRLNKRTADRVKYGVLGKSIGLYDSNNH